jgi:DNA-binding NarL/FixJ family response regulator
METEILSPIQPASGTRSAVTTLHTPVRVLLLSDHRLLRDALARALRSQADISLVGAHASSVGIAAEISESTCDVLLLDPVNNALDTQVLDHLEDRFSNLRIVMIDREAKIADVISAILSGSRTCQNLGNPHL